MMDWFSLALDVALIALALIHLCFARAYRKRWLAALAKQEKPEGVTRWCFKCNTHKPLDQFTPAAPDSPTRDGYNYGCNTCSAGLPKLRRCPETRRMYDPADTPAIL